MFEGYNTFYKNRNGMKLHGTVKEVKRSKYKKRYLIWNLEESLAMAHYDSLAEACLLLHLGQMVF